MSTVDIIKRLRFCKARSPHGAHKVCRRIRKGSGAHPEYFPDFKEIIKELYRATTPQMIKQRNCLWFGARIVNPALIIQLMEPPTSEEKKLFSDLFEDKEGIKFLGNYRIRVEQGSVWVPELLWTQFEQGCREYSEEWGAVVGKDEIPLKTVDQGPVPTTTMAKDPIRIEKFNYYLTMYQLTKEAFSSGS